MTAPVNLPAVMLPEVDAIEELLTATAQYAQQFLSGLPDLPTSRPAPALKTALLPETGVGGLAALHQFDAEFRQVIVGSAGPRYWGFVTGGTTPASIAGDWLTTVFDQNPQSVTGRAGGDVSATIEVQTLNLYRQLFKLPDHFMNGFVTGATMANFTGLAVARQWAGEQVGRNVAIQGVDPSSLRILAGVPHSSVSKCLAMLGLGSASIELVRTLTDREAMDIDHLRELLSQKITIPTIVLASGGTVNTVDFDDLSQLAQLRHQYGFWLHVDAAFGGFAALLPQTANRLTGWEKADSIAIDNHKWLNVPYDNAVWFVRREHASLQVQTFQNANAPYLSDPLADFNYLNNGPENSRRLRALPVWMSLMAYGRSGYQTIVERTIQMAQHFGERIEASDFLQLEAPVRLNVVCFSLRHHRADANRFSAFQQAINQDGRVFMTQTTYNGGTCLRAAFVNWRTTEADIELAMDVLEQAYRQAN